MTYDYREEMYEDVKNYIAEHYTAEDIRKYLQDRRDWWEGELYDDMFVADEVTGNASGSYTFNTYRAEEYLAHNTDLLLEAMDEFACKMSDYKGAEWADVTIRCYLLGEVLNAVLNDLENQFGVDEDDDEDDEDLE